MYSIVNEHGETINDAWDGHNMKFTFRRIVGRDSSGKYSVQPLYDVVNNCGVKQIYTHVV
jgi:hypothetical protein